MILTFIIHERIILIWKDPGCNSTWNFIISCRVVNLTPDWTLLNENSNKLKFDSAQNRIIFCCYQKHLNNDRIFRLGILVFFWKQILCSLFFELEINGWMRKINDETFDLKHKLDIYYFNNENFTHISVYLSTVNF